MELFAIGSEAVTYYKDNYYITGPGYEFRVILYDNTYHITGKPRYKETIQFIEKTLNRTKEVN